MGHKFNADSVLNGVVTSDPRVPGVVAMVTDREKNIYEGAAGVRRIDGDTAMTTDDVFAIFSTTKAITATAALQLLRRADNLKRTGERLRARYRKAQGDRRLRRRRRADPARPETPDHDRSTCCSIPPALDTTSSPKPTTGLRRRRASPASSTASKASLMTPLRVDPGDKWEYGTNIDWCGQVVEGITGKRQGEVLVGSSSRSGLKT